MYIYVILLPWSSLLNINITIAFYLIPFCLSDGLLAFSPFFSIRSWNTAILIQIIFRSLVVLLPQIFFKYRTIFFLSYTEWPRSNTFLGFSSELCDFIKVLYKFHIRCLIWLKWKNKSFTISNILFILNTLSSAVQDHTGVINKYICHVDPFIETCFSQSRASVLRL